MRISLRLEPSRSLLALFLLFLLFLAGAYLGQGFRVLYVFYGSCLFINFLHFAWSIRSIYHYQNFSTTSPERGQTIDYRLTLHNQSLIPGCRTRIALAEQDAFNQGLRTEPIRDFIPGSDSFHLHDYTLRCLFRGIHATGLSSIRLTDSLCLAKAYLPVVPETLHVLPRLVELGSCRLYNGTGFNQADRPASEGIEDYTCFRDLGDYPPGSSTRHLDWKRFAAWGRPVIRRFDNSAKPGLCIYLDRIHQGLDNLAERETDDCCVETALAVGLFHLRRQVPVHIRLEEGFVHLDNDGDQFSRFLLSTVSLRFSDPTEPAASLLDEFEEDRRTGRLPTNQILGIFRRFDRQTLSFLEDYNSQMAATRAVVLTSLLDETELRQVQTYRLNLPEGRLFLVHGSDSLRDDLG